MLPTGEQKIPFAFKIWKIFAQFSPFLQVDLVIESGITRRLGKDEKRAYRAPFPSSKYKAGIRALPNLVPVSLNDPESNANRKAWKTLSKWEKPFLTAFSNDDPITRGGDEYMQKRIPGAPVHRSVLESFSKLIVPEAKIHTPYGATEALPVTDINTSELLQSDSNETENENGICIGYPINGLDAKIIEITDSQILSWNDAIQMPVNEVGEIVVKGQWVSTEYFNNPDANRLAKIPDSGEQGTWHRMGDLGRIDGKGRLWFYGRKLQRVITQDGPLLTIPCEAVFNRHPLVSRSALVGIPGIIAGLQKPVICIQLETGNRPTKKLIRELLEIGGTNKLTKGISDILFYDKFPVDPRHNAKIFREKLAKLEQNL